MACIFTLLVDLTNESLAGHIIVKRQYWLSSESLKEIIKFVKEVSFYEPVTLTILYTLLKSYSVPRSTSSSRFLKKANISLNVPYFTAYFEWPEIWGLNCTLQAQMFNTGNAYVTHSFLLVIHYQLKVIHLVLVQTLRNFISFLEFHVNLTSRCCCMLIAAVIAVLKLFRQY